jgi:hypothetical protein
MDASPLPSLPPEADPSGLTERAPALATLLPDEALSLALARGDTHAVHATLIARLASEPPGPPRDTLQQLLAQPELFAVAERPPRLGELLGTGLALVGAPSPDKQQQPFVATRALRLFRVPLWPLSQHLVRRGKDGELEVLGGVPSTTGLRVMRAVSVLAVGAVVLVGFVAGLMPLLLREVHIINGLSRPVYVEVDDRPQVKLEPGTAVTERVFSLAGKISVYSRWDESLSPFELLSVSAGPRIVYNILGAASVQVDDPEDPAAPRQLEEFLASLEPGEELVSWKGGWEDTAREYADAGRWRQATEVAEEVALADPTALRAREEALRWTPRYDRAEAESFLPRLIDRYPDDRSAHELVQDVSIAMGRSERSRKYYAQWAAEAPDSVLRALLHARSLLPEDQPRAYASVLERFPNSPEAKNEAARLYLEDNAPQKALELLELVPTSLEGVELRVRALITLKRLREASNTVRIYSLDPKHLSWELAVLAGRLDRLAGPTRAQYITHDLIPPPLTQSPEHMVAFALLTGESTVKDAELRAIIDPAAREALEITREITQDLKKATERASTARDSVLGRIPLEAAAVLALELSRNGDAHGASRVFGSHLALSLAKEPLETFLFTGTESPRMALLPPALHATAHLIRARSLELEAQKREEQSHARQVEVLGGFARRALDPGYAEYDPNPPPPIRHYGCGRRQIIQIIKGGGPPAQAPQASSKP